MDRSRRSDNVVLVHSVAADTDGTDEFSVAVERKAAGENRDAIRQVRIRDGRRRIGCSEINAIQRIGNADRNQGILFLQTEQWSGRSAGNAGRVKALGQ